MPLDRNRRLAFKLSAVAAFMVGLAFAAVPLYRVFCRATGFGGTTQRAFIAPAAEAIVPNRMVTVGFNADSAPDLPWEFMSETRKVTLPVGEAATVKFRAKNLSFQPIIGTAMYNVQPDKAGIYFNKTECFCFKEQLLQPGQSAEFPVTFFLDPDLVKDRNLDDVLVITLSFTFFFSFDQEKSTLARPGILKNNPSQ